ncbi:MAG: TraB/GumN family protein [Roseateles sp.]|uniref:TraB/GumN family protein n=1 Tax=Roseateles sp. TaxID=1971397 RepID=UPI0039E97DB9
MKNFLSESELETVRLAWTKKLNGKASMTARTLGELNTCSFSMLLLPTGGGSLVLSSGHKSGVSWEEEFLKEAKTSGQAIFEFEPNGMRSTCEKLLAGEMRALALDAAKNRLDDVADEKAMRHTELMNRSIRRRDTKEGYAHMLDLISFSEDYKNAFLRLLNMRNEAFVSVLEQRHSKLDNGSIFVMFGALHLHGPNGVLALLQAKGFHVIPSP